MPPLGHQMHSHGKLTGICLCLYCDMYGYRVRYHAVWDARPSVMSTMPSKHPSVGPVLLISRAHLVVKVAQHQRHRQRQSFVEHGHHCNIAHHRRCGPHPYGQPPYWPPHCARRVVPSHSSSSRGSTRMRVTGTIPEAHHRYTYSTTRRMVQIRPLANPHMHDGLLSCLILMAGRHQPSHWPPPASSRIHASAPLHIRLAPPSNCSLLSTLCRATAVSRNAHRAAIVSATL